MCPKYSGHLVILCQTNCLPHLCMTQNWGLGTENLNLLLDWSSGLMHGQFQYHPVNHFPHQSSWLIWIISCSLGICFYNRFIWFDLLWSSHHWLSIMISQVEPNVFSTWIHLFLDVSFIIRIGYKSFAFCFSQHNYHSVISLVDCFLNKPILFGHFIQLGHNFIPCILIQYVVNC